MRIITRSERISDYNSIANITYEAFLGWMPENFYVTEPMLVDYLRHNSRFNPDLSLVAEAEGEIVGHVVFTPYKFIVLGVEQSGVVLGPISVKPSFQRKGIGRMLIEEGHRRAKEMGYTFSLLCGHEDYYPKFGYRTGMFSMGGVKTKVNREGFNGTGFISRPVNEQDIPWLLETWGNLYGEAAISLFPGEFISDWNNYGFNCLCAVVLKKDRILGYVRYVRTPVLNVKVLLAKAGEDVPDILAYLLTKEFNEPAGEVRIALPAEKVRPLLTPEGGQAIIDEQSTHQAFMIKVFEENSLIARYCRQVEEGLVKPGIIVFPSAFDAEEGRD